MAFCSRACRAAAAIERLLLTPGLEGIFSPPQRWLKLRIVSKQYTCHIVVIDPIEPGLGVDARCIVLREEAVALEASRRHKQKYAESCFTNGKAVEWFFCKHADEKVNALHIVLINLTEFAYGIRVIR